MPPLREAVEAYFQARQRVVGDSAK